VPLVTRTVALMEVVPVEVQVAPVIPPEPLLLLEELELLLDVLDELELVLLLLDDDEPVFEYEQ
jgi:hypothetical protein